MNLSGITRAGLNLLGGLLAMPLLIVAAQAQVFVSAKNGVDVGSCPVTAPCRTITYSLNQVGSGGVVNVIDSGNYEAFVVTKSVTVQAAPGVVAVVTRNTAGPGIIIKAEGTEYITIRGLTLNLPDNLLTPNPPPGSPGFSLAGGGSVLIERCVIRGFTPGVDAKMVGALVLRETSVSGALTGINLTSEYLTLRVTIDRCQVVHAGAGVNATTVPGAMIRMHVLDSLFSGGSSGVNIAPDRGGAASVNIENCRIANYKYGLQATGSGAIVRVSNSVIFDNGIGLVSGGGAALLSRGNNTVEGNEISSDFTGTFLAK